MLDYLAIILTSVGFLVTVIIAVSACLCGSCSKTNQKNELTGMPGIVKLNIDEEVTTPLSVTPASVKRASGQNSQRSLPEIPNAVTRHDSGDTASEIYATVNLDEGGEKNKVPRIREHPYEHAYAKLQNEMDSIEVVVEPPATSDDVREATAETRQDDDLIEPESIVISASVAISGNMPSSQELPYITPPSPQQRGSPQTQQQPQHFSGDSTESTKGYTSISVREPLSNIRAATKLKQAPHYATVSDDSDEMYAAIEDESVSGSETYAQIQNDSVQRMTTCVQAEINIIPTSNTSHSRQESASSCSNSVVNIGSPKPEKRQANSPLPAPPPAGSSPQPGTSTATAVVVTQRISSTGDLHLNHDRNRRSLNEKHTRNHSCVSSSDFYGCNYPVEKHRFSSGDLIRPLVAKELNFDIDKPVNKDNDNIYNVIDPPTAVLENGNDAEDSNGPKSLEIIPKNLEDMYAKVDKRKNQHLDENFINHNIAVSSEDPEYETIDRKASLHGYEKIIKHKKNQDPGYETVGESVRKNGAKRLSEYEEYASETEPNYEKLAGQTQNPTYAVIPGDYKKEIPAYSVVNKKHWKTNNDIASEPNYESMPHESIYTTSSESDPNYESVNPKMPDYESLRQDPNYESLRSKNSNYASLVNCDHNYDSLKKASIRKDPTYEKVDEHSNVVQDDDSKIYESIKPRSEGKAENDSVGDYFQV